MEPNDMNALTNENSSVINRIVIIGSGIAGFSAAKAAIKQDPTSKVTIVSQEIHPPYYRLRICELIGKDAPPESFYINPYPWYEENGVELILSRKVQTINQSEKFINTDNGKIYYDHLIIASGSTPAVPPFKGKELQGIHTIWNIEDISAINETLKYSKSALVIGGGLLGLETAYYIKQMGISTTLIEALPRLLPKQLDEEGSIIFETNVTRLGINVVTGLSVGEFRGKGRVSEVILSDGQSLDADIVIISVGVRPNTNICSESGILINRFIPINAKMQVNILKNSVDSASSVITDSSSPINKEENPCAESEWIFAAGDVATFNKEWFGLWTVASAQGQVAGTNAAGGNASYVMENSPYILSTMGTKVIVSGDVNEILGEESEVLKDSKLDSCSYVKLVFKAGILTGGILMGNASSGFIKLQQLIKAHAHIDTVHLSSFLPK